MMSYKITDIEGIGPAFAERLAAAGISTTAALLKQCADAKGRERVAEDCGLRPQQLLRWANMADLMRISGVGGEFAELLEAAGVDTVKELGARNSSNLALAMVEVNRARKLTRRVPSASLVNDWVSQAKSLPPVITH